MPGKGHLPELTERIIRTLKANTNRTVGGFGSNASPGMTRDRVAASRRGSSTLPPTAKSSKVDWIDIADTATGTFPLTYRPIRDSWNVELNGAGLNDDADAGDVEYQITNKTLTVEDPTDTFRGVATQGGPWRMRVQYDYLSGVPAKPTSPAQSEAWQILSNVAAINLGVFSYLPRGSVVTEVEGTIAGTLSDIGIGFRKSSGNYLTAQVTSTHVRLLDTIAFVDGFAGLAQTAFVVTSPAALKMTANWSTGAIAIYIDGVLKVSHTLSAGNLAIFANPTAAHLRGNGAPGSVTVENLKVNGSLVDNFNRTDQAPLGDASTSGSWVDGP